MNQFNQRRASKQRKHPSQGSSFRGSSNQHSSSYGPRNQRRGNQRRGNQRRGNQRRGNQRGNQRRGNQRRGNQRGPRQKFGNQRFQFDKNQKKYYAVLADGGVIFTEWKACNLFIKEKEDKMEGRVLFKSFLSRAEADNWIKSDGKKFYAVINQKGKKTIFTNWTECEKANHPIMNQTFKSFPTEVEAKAWLDRNGKPLKKLYVVIDPSHKDGGMIFNEWNACQAYMGKMSGPKNQRIRYKSFLSEPEAKQWLTLGGLTFKTMKSLETGTPRHVSWKTYIVQKFKLIPSDFLQSLGEIDPHLRGEGNKMVKNEDPMQYSALMGVFIDFLMMRELCIQSKQPFIAKAARLSLNMFTPYMVTYKKHVKVGDRSGSDDNQSSSSVDEGKIIRKNDNPFADPQSSSSVDEEKSITKKVVGYGLERDLLHQFTQDVNTQFIEIKSKINNAISKVEDLAKPNLDILKEALLLCQFENVARKEKYCPKEIDLNINYLDTILKSITECIKFVLNQESKNGPIDLHVQPDLSSKTTKAECDFIIGDTIFDIKCLFSIVAPMKSIERSLIQYILYAAMANDPSNQLNDKYKQINNLVILLPIQQEVLFFDLSKIPFDHICKSFYL